MELIKFKDFNRVEINTVFQGETIEFVIIINLKQSVFSHAIESWIVNTDYRTCQSLCDYINITDGHIAYTESDLAVLSALPVNQTIN